MLKIIEHRNATAAEWDAMATACDYATFFHTREWAEIWHSYTEGRMRPDARLLRFSDLAQVLLPVSSRKVARGYCDSSFPHPNGLMADGCVDGRSPPHIVN